MTASTSRTRVPDIRKGDTVVVLSGKDAGKRGVVERVYASPRSSTRGYAAGRPSRTEWGAYVVVGGLNIAKRHQKARMRQGGGRTAQQVQQGGIIEVPAPIDISNVMIVCPHCDRVTRVGHETLASGERVRVCKHCGEQLESVQ